MNDEIFSVYAALHHLNERIERVEKHTSDYTADMFEVYRNLGVLTKRIEELESRIKDETA
jgi:uncharacterized protein (UPF0335 family)